MEKDQKPDVIYNFHSDDFEFVFNHEKVGRISFLTFTRKNDNCRDYSIRLYVRPDSLEVIKDALGVRCASRIASEPAEEEILKIGEVPEKPESSPDESGIDLHFVVVQDRDSGESIVFKSFLYEEAAFEYYDNVAASNPGKVVSLITHKVFGVFGKDLVDELKTRIGQLDLFKTVCSKSLEVERERVKNLEEENEALKRVIKLTL